MKANSLENELPGKLVEMAVRAIGGASRFAASLVFWKTSDGLRRFDEFALVALFAFVLLFKLQTVFVGVAQLRLRELLFLYLYLRAFWAYPVFLNSRFVWLIAYIGFAVWIAFHTAVLYGMEMAGSGFTRFVSLTLLAPLAAIMITQKRQVRRLIGVWLGVTAAGAVTGAYQFFGGKLPSISQGFLAARGGLPRYMTLLGEPNIGGMASGICLMLGIFWVRTRAMRLLVFVCAIALSVLSISKAAIFGIGIALLFVVSTSRDLSGDSRRIYRDYFKSTLKTAPFRVLSVFALFTFLIWQSPITHRSQTYFLTQADEFLGTRSGAGVLSDVKMRINAMPEEGLEILMSTQSPVSNTLLGGSFGIAGSAATELGMSQSLPHNGVMEIFMVGGVAFLALFLMVIGSASGGLIFAAMADRTYLGLLGAFWLAVFYNLSYPIIYVPTIGALFWLIVGLSASPILTKLSPVEGGDFAE